MLVTGGIALAGVPASLPADTKGSPPAQAKGNPAGQTGKQNRPTTSGQSTAPGKVNLAPPVAPNVTLYDQYDNASTTASVSQDFETALDPYDSQLADDFVVPGGQSWTINEVDVAGVYFNGPGPAASFNVYIYQNNGPLPGTQVYAATGLAYTGSTDFVIPLTSPATLAGGDSYWVSVQARMDFTPNGEWGWTDRTAQANNGAAWRNPGDGFATGCIDWTGKTVCIPTALGPDQVYRLMGTVQTGTATPTSTGTPPTATNTPVATATACAVSYTIATATGTIVPGVTDTGNHVDDGTTTIPLPFGVNLYGNIYNSAIVGSNGTLGFVANGNAFTNTCLPAAAENYAILPYWDDQQTNTGLAGCTAWANGCGIFTTQVGNNFYIDFHTVLFADNSVAEEYEVIFTQGSADFSVVYGSPITDTASETIGVQKDTGSAFTLYKCNTANPPITSGLQLNFIQSSCVIDTNTPTPSTPTNTPHVTATPTCQAGGTPGPWTAAAPYPINIVRYGFAQVGDSFYVIGGVSDGTRVNNVNRYDVGPNTWTPLANIPVASEAPTCAYNSGTNKIYCAEGDTGNSFQIYDIASNSWTSGPAVPGATDRYGAASGSFGNFVYIVGGSTAIQSDVQVYNISTNTWSAGTPAANALLLAGYHEEGQYLYVVGGFSSGGPNKPANGLASSVLNKNGQSSKSHPPANSDQASPAQPGPGAPDANNATTLRLDMTSGTWSTGPAFTPSRADFGLAYSGGKLYAMGGDATGGGFFDSTNLVDELDVSAWPSGTWTSSPPALPTPNRQANQAGFTSADGRIWSVGGLDGSTFQFLPDNYYRSNGGCGTPGPTDTPTATPTCQTGGGGTPGPWATSTPGPPTRYRAGGVSDGTYVYVLGGSNDVGAYLNDLWRWDPSTQTWAQLTNMPTGKSNFQGAYWNGKIYAPGGYTGAHITENAIYDIATDTWSTGAPLPAAQSGQQAAFNGKIYNIGGNPGPQTTVTIYDIATDTWSTGAAMPVATTYGRAITVGSYIYYVGGIATVTTNAVYRYDPTANTWATMAPLQTARTSAELMSDAAGTQIFAVMGGDDTFFTGVPLAVSVEIYDIASDSWTYGNPVVVKAAAPSGGAAGGKLMVQGGVDGTTYYNTVQVSTLSGGGGCATDTPTPTAGTPTATATCVGSVQLLQDPSFEAGTPNPDWAEGSTNFGTPLCTLALCGDGGGTAGPRTGDWWSWFGGTASVEDAFVSQDVNIPSGAATLEFYLWIGAHSGNGASDYVRVLMDNTEVFRATDADTGYDSGYTLVTLDVSSFAGGMHTVRVEEHNDASAANVFNANVDDVTLTAGGGCGTPVPTEHLPIHLN